MSSVKRSWHSWDRGPEWHFSSQFGDTFTATLPLSSALGLVSAVVAGLLFGDIFQWTGSILAPWLAHAIGGIALVLIGEMSFVQYVPRGKASATVTKRLG
jgi:hypothetical protein